MTIWVNEQIDPCGLIHSCIACMDEISAKECHESFKRNLTPEQIESGWLARLRTVEDWTEVPVTALKLS